MTYNGQKWHLKTNALQDDPVISRFKKMVNVFTMKARFRRYRYPGRDSRLSGSLNQIFCNAILPIFLLTLLTGCDDGLSENKSNFKFAHHLSDYGIFSGELASLTPAPGYHAYALSTELFSDYALKQRLFRLPKGQRFSEQGGGLPDFPDSTILVKTFYYQNDLRNADAERRILETRLMVRHAGQWNMATYVWNASQDEAMLATSGFNTRVNWINERGEGTVISYHVPSTRECVTCHKKSNIISPIGPTIRNLHRSVMVDGAATNQLAHLEDLGLLQRSGSTIEALPAWNTITESLETRVRAYLEVNCGHCHAPRGFASQSRLYLGFNDTGGGGLTETRLNAISTFMRRGRMPLIGTTLVHQEALELIEAYIKSLK